MKPWFDGSTFNDLEIYRIEFYKTIEGKNHVGFWTFKPSELNLKESEKWRVPGIIETKIFEYPFKIKSDDYSKRFPLKIADYEKLKGIREKYGRLNEGDIKEIEDLKLPEWLGIRPFEYYYSKYYRFIISSILGETIWDNFADTGEDFERVVTKKDLFQEAIIKLYEIWTSFTENTTGELLVKEVKNRAIEFKLKRKNHKENKWLDSNPVSPENINYTITTLKYHLLEYRRNLKKDFVVINAGAIQENTRLNTKGNWVDDPLLTDIKKISKREFIDNRERNKKEYYTMHEVRYAIRKTCSGFNNSKSVVAINNNSVFNQDDLIVAKIAIGQMLSGIKNKNKIISFISYCLKYTTEETAEYLHISQQAVSKNIAWTKNYLIKNYGVI